MNEYVLWKIDPTTKKILKEIQEEIKKCESDISEGSILANKNTGVIAVAYSKMIGRIEGLRLIESFFQRTIEEEDSADDPDEFT